MTGEVDVPGVADELAARQLEQIAEIAAELEAELESPAAGLPAVADPPPDPLEPIELDPALGGGVAVVPVHVALARIAAEVGPVVKGRRADGGGYRFRGIDDVMNAVHAAFAAAGVIPVPFDVRVDRIPWRDGWALTRVRVRWTFYGPAGDTLETELVGEALDDGDKGLGKARSYSLKDLLSRMLTLPTGDPDADTESTVAPAADDDLELERAAVAAGFASEAARKAQHDAARQLGELVPAELRDPLRDYVTATGWPMTADELEQIVAMTGDLLRAHGPERTPPALEELEAELDEQAAALDPPEPGTPAAELADRARAIADRRADS